MYVTVTKQGMLELMDAGFVMRVWSAPLREPQRMLEWLLGVVALDGVHLMAAFVEATVALCELIFV
jgi:hypothetical protein